MGNCGTKVAPEPTQTKNLISYGELLKQLIAKLPEKTPDVRVDQIARVTITQACAHQLREDIKLLGYTDVRFAQMASGSLLIYVGLNTEVSLTKEVYPPDEVQSGRSCVDSSRLSAREN